MTLPIESFAQEFDPKFKVFHELMARKVRDILLVSTPYDAWIMEEDCRLSERIIHEYRGLNLSNPPRITWVPDRGEGAARPFPAASSTWSSRCWVRAIPGRTPWGARSSASTRTCPWCTSAIRPWPHRPTATAKTSPNRPGWIAPSSGPGTPTCWWRSSRAPKTA